MELSRVDKIINEQGFTELHLAAFNQDVDWVQVCVKDEFDINKKDKNGWTPLIWAIDMGCTSNKGVCENIITFLIAHGASIEFWPEGYNSLVDFAMNIHPEIGHYLIEQIEKKS